MTHIGVIFARVPIGPNTWTLLSIPPAAAGLYALSVGMLLPGLALFAIAASLDAIDGAVARAKDRTTDYGAYLDGMTDRFVEAALLFGLMVFGYPDWVLPGWLWLSLLLFFGTAMTSFARAYADHRGVVTEPAELDAMGGFLERAERMVLIFASMVLWIVEPVYATYTVALATGLAVVTVVQRMRRANVAMG